MHNFKKLVSPVILMIIIICVNEMLCFAAKPYSFFRFDMHNLENGEEYTDIFVGTSHGKAAIAPEKANAAIAAQNGCVDNVIASSQLRDTLVNSIEIMAGKRISRLPKKHSNIQL